MAREIPREVPEGVGRLLEAMLRAGVRLRLDTAPPATARDIATMAYSERTRKLIAKAIELDPALEETILAIAEHAYADGEEAERDSEMGY